MSLMKRYAEDMEAFTMRAIEVAWHKDAGYREAAFSELLRDCETAARVYASPAEVAVLFVNHVTDTYAAEFMAQREAA
ncbi:hypothetical protein [Streptomyces sp. WG5]|uniref:hypothetical protein n=1 Tax=Streptomyces sp. WG5 TaxID=3417648 RepID=UPI003CF53CEF